MVWGGDKRLLFGFKGVPVGQRGVFDSGLCGHAPVAHRKGSNRGVSGFWVGTSRMGAEGGLWGFSWVLGASDYFARSL